MRLILIFENLGGHIMTMLKKAIASLVTCVFMISTLTLNVMAESVTYIVGDATLTVFWTKTSTSATVYVTTDKPAVNTHVSISGIYHLNGTTATKTVSNDNNGAAFNQVTISNGGGTWISLNAVISVTYGSESNKITLQL